ncbi:hypothetical protein TWF281_000252 [Arthrobotrys megalospora]
MIKRKPVSNPSVALRYESQAKSPQVHQIRRKPVSPSAALPRTFNWPTISPTDTIAGESAATPMCLTVENVDGNDHKKFLEKVQNEPIEYESYSTRIYGRENVVSEDTRPHTFDTAVGAGVPTTSTIEYATIGSECNQEIPSISTLESPLAPGFENSEAKINPKIETMVQPWDSNYDVERHVYEEFSYHLNGEHRTLTLISKETIHQTLESHKRKISETRFAVGYITGSSVGPISRMLSKWLACQPASDQPADTVHPMHPRLTDELGILIQNTSTNTIYGNYGSEREFQKHKEWNTLWALTGRVRSFCYQLFSLGTPQDLLSSCSRLQMPKLNEGPNLVIIGEVGDALLRELSDAITQNWLNKGRALLNAGRIWDSGAQSALKYMYHCTYYTIDDCHRFRNEVLIGHWRQFLRNVAEERPHPPQPFASAAELFSIIQAFEKPREPPRYLPNLHPELQWLITTNFSTTFEPEEYQLVKREDVDVCQEYLSARQNAIMNKEWEGAIKIIDQMLFSIYPGIEEAKRWLAVKAYLLAITQDWNASATIQDLLQREALGTNDRLRLDLYFTNAMTALVYQKNIEAARKFCDAALQLPGFVVPENECVCDRKNADILYGLLYPDANEVVENRGPHIPRLNRALSAWSQGGHLFEPGAPFHTIVGVLVPGFR